MPESAPRQAVILAGGRGVRMRPLTDDRPKPMIEFGGRPFLAYVVERLAAEGFDRILMLLGYLPDVISDYFGDGSAYGVSIDYSVSSADDLTSRRLQIARDRLDPLFMLMYCDNYWPIDRARHWERYREIGAKQRQPVAQPTSTQAGHDHVGDDQVHPLAVVLQRAEGLRGFLRLQTPVAVAPERAHHERPHQRLVLHHQHRLVSTPVSYTHLTLPTNREV